MRADENDTTPPTDDARPSQSTVDKQRRVRSEHWVVLLVLFGGFLLPVVGWLVGVAALWSRRCWDVRVKLVGTLVWPMSALLVAGISIAWYGLLFPLRAPLSSVGTSVFLLVPQSWLVALLLVGRWLLDRVRPLPDRGGERAR
ncbi:hypothetical protein [Streptoalloteichus hindustanus]|uniref:Uncharacterized protein n=1 Tax=Streptoalloteichus hindustanus TaxID=2017 RepID=A0A1M5N681_STRHI|nr:hypothetical protein [Streptoalloteichus hindustanus]SHG85100.1 hypothetical protein SAMN05444320_1158 [Streptoalloteichus hindustanus]